MGTKRLASARGPGVYGVCDGCARSPLAVAAPGLLIRRHCARQQLGERAVAAWLQRSGAPQAHATARSRNAHWAGAVSARACFVPRTSLDLGQARARPSWRNANGSDFARHIRGAQVG